MRRRLWNVLGCFLLLCSTEPVGAQPERWNDAKPAWQWTLEERMAKRFDPAEEKVRAEKEAARLRDSPFGGISLMTDTQIQQAADTISGHENPELLTPGELFLDLLTRAYPSDGRDQRRGRQMIEERAVALGFGADLWTRLGRIASPFLELRREAERLDLAKQENRLTDHRLLESLTPEILCGVRADALAAAQIEFGEEAFLRLLYEVIAPTVSMPSFTAEKLLYVNGGCR